MKEAFSCLRRYMCGAYDINFDLLAQSIVKAGGVVGNVLMLNLNKSRKMYKQLVQTGMFDWLTQ